MAAKPRPPPSVLDFSSWRLASRKEVFQFFRKDRPKPPPPQRGRTKSLIVRTRLRPVDIYAYLRARFGEPNGFQNFLRKDDSDNWIHWDFNLKSGEADIWIAGTSREIHFVLTEAMTDREWQTLIVGFKRGVRAARAREIDHNEELREVRGLPWRLRAALPAHARAGGGLHQHVRADPPAAEPGEDWEAYQTFVREKIPDRIGRLHKVCFGMAAVDRTTEAYGHFISVMNKRNFNIHGNVDPEREAIETVYFEGKRPLFAEAGHHIGRYFADLERLHRPAVVVPDYEWVHAFLHELTTYLSPVAGNFLSNVIDDRFPGFETKQRKVTRILPDVVVMGLPGMARYDDDLSVTW